MIKQNPEEEIQFFKPKGKKWESDFPNMQFGEELYGWELFYKAMISPFNNKFKTYINTWTDEDWKLVASSISVSWSSSFSEYLSVSEASPLVINHRPNSANWEK